MISLDHVLVEWAAALPPALRFGRGRTKYVLKKALAPHLPPGIAWRRKQGFSVPLASWLRGPPLADRVEAAFAGPTFVQSGLFDPPAVRRLVDQHRSGRRDHGATIWALFMFAGFLRRVHPG